MRSRSGKRSRCNMTRGEDMNLKIGFSFHLSRLLEEIEKIRLLYSSYESEMKVSIKGIFDAKVDNKYCSVLIYNSIYFRLLS